MLILDLWNISFHAVVVFGLGNNLLFKSDLGHCVVFWTFTYGFREKGRVLDFEIAFRKIFNVNELFTMNRLKRPNYFLFAFYSFPKSPMNPKGC